jgi:hypothetical protein
MRRFVLAHEAADLVHPLGGEAPHLFPCRLVQAEERRLDRSGSISRRRISSISSRRRSEPSRSRRHTAAKRSESGEKTSEAEEDGRKTSRSFWSRARAGGGGGHGAGLAARRDLTVHDAIVGAVANVSGQDEAVGGEAWDVEGGLVDGPGPPPSRCHRPRGPNHPPLGGKRQRATVICLRMKNSPCMICTVHQVL